PTVKGEAALALEGPPIIGPQRKSYATRDHVEDLDAVRAALDVNKVALLGVSYGTKLALAFALGHPGNVERLLLDSVVVPSYPDPFERNVLRQMPGTLTGFCDGGVCRAATKDFSAEFVRLANQLETRPITGKVIT